MLQITIGFPCIFDAFLQMFYCQQLFFFFLFQVQMVNTWNLSDVRSHSV